MDDFTHAREGRATSVTIVVLAAGKSSRTEGLGHKLLATFAGLPLVRRSTLIATGSSSLAVVVVTGYRGAEIASVIADLDVTIVQNDSYQSGISSSIAVGVRVACKSDPTGIMVMLADMPALTTAAIDQLLMAFEAAGSQAIVRATDGGMPGNPVVLPRSLFDRLEHLTGDTGARRLIDSCGLPLIDVEIGHAASFDVDTPERLEAAGGLWGK